MTQVKIVLTESEFKGVMHVDVDRSVEAVKNSLAHNKVVEIAACQMEISRIGMIMKRVEEETKCRIVSMKTENKNKRVGDKDTRVLYFRVVFSRD